MVSYRRSSAVYQAMTLGVVSGTEVLADVCIAYTSALAHLMGEEEWALWQKMADGVREVWKDYDSEEQQLVLKAYRDMELAIREQLDQAGVEDNDMRSL